MCLSVCTPQKLLAAYDDLEEAVDEYKNPVEVEKEKPAPKAPKAPAPTAQTAATTRPLPAAAKGAKLDEQEQLIKVMQVKIDEKDAKINENDANAKSALTVMLEGAKATGVCMYLHLH